MLIKDIPDYPLTGKKTDAQIAKIAQQIVDDPVKSTVITREQLRQLHQGSPNQRKRVLAIWHQNMLIELAEQATSSELLHKLPGSQQDVLKRRYRGKLGPKQLDKIREALRALERIKLSLATPTGKTPAVA